VAIVAPVAAVQIQRPCPNCGREWGDGIHCQFCDQVGGLAVGIPLSSSSRRLGAHMLDVLLMIVTLYIGWLVWALIVASHGQSPGKQLLGMRVVKLQTGTHATWGLMFVREVLLKGILFGLIVTFTLGIGLLVYMWLIWDKNRQELWDKMINTIVVNDPNKLVV
jgi:uncharacterized RDD family membrane protein YckC